MGYGLQLSTEIYGTETGESGFPRGPTGTFFDLTEISGSLREFTGECDRGILYSSSTLTLAAKIPSPSQASTPPR